MACPVWLLLQAYHAHYHQACWAFALLMLLCPPRTDTGRQVTPQPA